MSERYIVSGEKNETYYEHFQRYHFAGDFTTDKDVLDVACGSGYGSYLLAESGARHVSGIDISPKAIGYCRKRYSLRNLSFETMDARDLGFADASLDVAVSFETIEHIDDQDAFLSELKRVLRPGGLIIISTPNKAVYGKLPRQAHRFHVKEFSLDEFRGLIERYFDLRKLYGQRRCDSYIREVIGYNQALSKAARENFFTKANPLRLKNYIPARLRYYLVQKIAGLPPPRISAEDLVITEDTIENSKFFICIAIKH